MNDYIQNLEKILALEPTNRTVRIELLETYLNYGIINQTDLRDLAALDDSAAIEIVGKHPSLESRSKHFYLRCAWAAILKAQSYMIAEIRLETKHRSGVDVPDYLEQNYTLSAEAIDGFNILFQRYLRRESPGSVPYGGFREDIGADLGNFSFIFRNLHRELSHVVNRVDTHHGLFREQLDFEQADRHQTAELIYAISHLLGAYSHLAAAIQKNPKSNTDEAILQAAIAINYAKGENYYNNRALQQVHRTANAFYSFLAMNLLQQCRPDIIKSWLPNYTPE